MELGGLLHVVVDMMGKKVLGQAVTSTEKDTGGDHVGLVRVGFKKMVVVSEKQRHDGCKTTKGRAGARNEEKMKIN